MERNNSCALPLSYPDISDIKPDPKTAAVLYEAYAGRNGELEAISNYIYQSILFEGSAPIVSEMLECIAMVEMEHFRLLGRTILLLGANPAIKTAFKTTHLNRKGDVVSRIEKALSEDVESEKRAAEFYNKTARYTKDRTLASLLKRLAADEEHHAKLLSDMLKKF